MRRLAVSFVCARRTERTTTLLCTPPLRPRCAELTAAGRKLIVYSVTNGCDRGRCDAVCKISSHRRRRRFFLAVWEAVLLDRFPIMSRLVKVCAYKAFTLIDDLAN